MTKPDQRTWNSPRTVLADQKTLLHEKRMSSMGALIFAVICMLGPLSIIVSGESRNTGALLVIVLFGAAFGVYGVYTMGLRKVLTVIPERGLIEEQSGRFKLDEKSFHPLTKFDGVRTRRRERGASKGRRKIFYFYDVFLSGPNETLPLGVFSRENQALDAAIRLANILRLRLIDGISAGAGKPIKVPYEVIKKLQPDSHANDPWWKRAPVISLIAANLVPIGGVLLANWEIFPILLFYWLENLAIAVFSVASIAWAERASLYEKFSNSFVSLGMFAVFQSVLALVILVFFPGNYSSSRQWSYREKFSTVTESAC